MTPDELKILTHEVSIDDHELSKKDFIKFCDERASSL